MNFNRFTSGKDSTLLLETLHDDVWNAYAEYMLRNDESFDERFDKKNSVSISSRLQEINDAIFVQKYNSSTYRRDIGKMRFSKENKMKFEPTPKS